MTGIKAFHHETPARPPRFPLPDPSAVQHWQRRSRDRRVAKAACSKKGPRPAVERMTITMSAELAETLRQTVAEDGYASTSAVVREALRDWTRRRDVER